MKPMPARGPGISLLVRILVPIVLLAVIWALADTDETLRRLGNVHWGWAGAAVAGVSLQTILSTMRWQWVSNSLGAPLSYRFAVGEYYLSQLVNQSVPGGVVGDAARAVRARSSGGLSRAAQAVIIDRMIGQISLWSVLAAAMIVAVATPEGIAWPLDRRAMAIALGLAIALGAAGLWLWRSRSATARHLGAAIYEAVLAPDIRWRQLGLALAIVGVNLASFAFAAAATGTSLSLEATLTLVPLILSAMLIPATIAGWGFREGAAAALFPLAGASASAGFAASLLFGLVMLVASLPGLAVLIGKRGAVTP